MRRPVGLLGPTLVIVGLFVALFPAISVWRVSGTVLEELPEAPTSEATDQRHRLALFDGDFVLATRTYHDTTTEAVRSTFEANGFEPVSANGERWLSRDCCGDYDAVWVGVEETAPGSVEAIVTVADSDVVTTWPIFAVLGSLLVGAGAAIALAVSRPSIRAPRPLAPRRS